MVFILVPRPNVPGWSASPGLHQINGQCREMPLQGDGVDGLPTWPALWRSHHPCSVLACGRRGAGHGCCSSSWAVSSLRSGAGLLLAGTRHVALCLGPSWRSPACLSLSSVLPGGLCRARLSSISACSSWSPQLSGGWGHFCPECPPWGRLFFLLASPGLAFLQGGRNQFVSFRPRRGQRY